MAYVERLKAPQNGMEEFLNVGAKVGVDPDCPNRQADVRAIQQLLSIIINGTPGVKLGVPAPTGEFDAITGFHIFNIQNFVKKKKPGTVVDGCVSPARGISYGGGIYSILNLNAMAHHKDKAQWARILEPYRPL